MDRALLVRPIIVRPDAYLGKEPSKRGYWGFVRCQADYESERQILLQELQELVDALNREGHQISLLPALDMSWKTETVLANRSELEGADVNLLVTFSSPKGGIFLPDVGGPLYGLMWMSKFVVLFEKFRPNIYGGTLFSPPSYQLARAEGLGHSLFMVEGKLAKLASILRALHGLKKIQTSRLICVGPANTNFGGWLTLSRGQSRFGYKLHRLYSFDQFEADFQRSWQDSRPQARQIADEFVSRSTRTIEPTEEDLLRAATYYLVLHNYLEDEHSDWVTVNCLTQILSHTKATPCMAFAILNDEGKVGTCEADPTAAPLHYLMRHIAGRPAFFNDPTVNEKEGTLILAHCTSPTRLLGIDKASFAYEVRTHHESNLSATVKPTYQPGPATVAGLSFDFKRMLIIKGQVLSSPELRICRSQVELKVDHPTRILNDWQGFHWIMVYGDITDELVFLCQATNIEPLVHS